MPKIPYYLIHLVVYLWSTSQNLVSNAKKPLHFKDTQWGIYNTSSLKYNGFFKHNLIQYSSGSHPYHAYEQEYVFLILELNVISGF